MDDRWMSVEEIASYLNVSEDTVYTRANERRMPGHDVGRFWKFERDEVDVLVRKWACGSGRGPRRAGGGLTYG